MVALFLGIEGSGRHGLSGGQTGFENGGLRSMGNDGRCCQLIALVDHQHHAGSFFGMYRAILCNYTSTSVPAAGF